MTLLEIMICSGLMSLIFLGTYMIMDHGLRFFRLNGEANDAQRGVLLFFSRLGAVTQNTRDTLIYVDPFHAIAPTDKTVQAYDPSQGIAYVSPFDRQNQLQFDGTTKQQLWQQYGTFYLTPDKELRWVGKWMNETSFPGHPVDAPPGPDGCVPSMKPDSVLSYPHSQLLTRNVTRLAFKYHQVGEVVSVSPPVVAKNSWYEVEIECGRKGDNLSYWTRLQSGFYPKNT